MNTKPEKERRKPKIYGAFNFRPLVLAAIGFGLGIFAMALESIVFLGAFIMCAILLFTSLSLKNRTVFILSFFILFGMFRACIIYRVEYPIESGEHFISGNVYSIYDNNIVLSDVRIDSKLKDGNILVKNTDMDVDIDDRVELIATLEQTTRMEDKTYKYYLLSENYNFVTTECYDGSVISHTNSLHGIFAGMHNRLSDKIDLVFGRHAPEVKGILLGDSSEIPEDTSGNLRDTGLAHLLALSGLHVSIICGALYFVIKRLNKYLRFGIVAAFLVIYCSVTAFPASLMRASVMTFFGLAAPLFTRRNDMLTSCSAAFLLILLINPYQLFAAGFVLSFSAVLGIALLYRSYKNILSFALPDFLSKPLSTSIAATSGTMPAMTAYFHRMPIYSLITNLIFIPVASLAVTLAFAALVISLVCAPIAAPLAFVVNMMFDVIIYSVNVIAKLPFAVLTTQSLSFVCGLLYCLRMVVMSPYYITRPKYRLRISIGLSVLTFAALLL